MDIIGIYGKNNKIWSKFLEEKLVKRCSKNDWYLIDKQSISYIGF